jgi:hypothetical protein
MAGAGVRGDDGRGHLPGGGGVEGAVLLLRPTLLPNSSPAARRHPARMPRPEHTGRERAGNPGPLRPPGHRHALPNNRPSHQRARLPPPAPRPGKPPGNAAGHTGMHARLGGPSQAGNTPPARPVRGRPWNSRRCAPTVLALGCRRYAFVDTATRRPTVTYYDARRDKKETARLAENP